MLRTNAKTARMRMQVVAGLLFFPFPSRPVAEASIWYELILALITAIFVDKNAKKQANLLFVCILYKMHVSSPK